MTGSSPPVPPFADVEEVPLAAAPIVRVVAQARYGGNASRMTDAAAERFAQAVASWLPFSDRAQGLEVVIGPGGVQQQPGQSVQWTFTDGGDRRVTLTSSWVSYDVGPYESRTRFCADLELIFGTLSGLIGAVPVARLGVRYINQIVAPAALKALPSLVRPQLLGLLSAPEHADVLVHSFTESLFGLGDASLQVRHGLLPAGALVDPTVPAVPRPSWMLDLDAFSETAPALGGPLASRARELASLAYNYFRWAMTQQALALFKETDDAAG